MSQQDWTGEIFSILIDWGRQSGSAINRMKNKTIRSRSHMIKRLRKCWFFEQCRPVKLTKRMTICRCMYICMYVYICVAVSTFYTCEHVWMEKAAYGREIKCESEKMAWVRWSWAPYQNQISRTFRFRSCTNPVECVATVQVFKKNRYKCRCTHSRIYTEYKTTFQQQTFYDYRTRTLEKKAVE